MHLTTRFGLLSIVTHPEDVERLHVRFRHKKHAALVAQFSNDAGLDLPAPQHFPGKFYPWGIVTDRPHVDALLSALLADVTYARVGEAIGASAAILEVEEAVAETMAEAEAAANTHHGLDGVSKTFPAPEADEEAEADDVSDDVS